MRQSDRNRSTPRAARFHGLAVLGVCGHSGSGKTTLLVETIRLLVARRLRVAVIKHVSHALEPDRPGKDSDRLFAAGATVVAAAADQAFARWRPGGDGQFLEQLLALARVHDLVLVEGHSRMPVPKLWLRGPRDEAPPDDVCGLIDVWGPSQATPERLAGLALRRIEHAQASRPLFGGVLIGGASRRMGRPKQLIEYAGRSFLEHVVAAVTPHVGRVVLLGGGPVPAALAGLPRLNDPPGIAGPLAGMLAAMRWAPAACWLFAACDQPRLDAEAIGWLLSHRGPARWAVLPRVGTNHIEPLPGLYEPQAAHWLEGRARREIYGLQTLAGDDHIAHPDVPPRWHAAWESVNTPEQLKAMQER